MGSAVGVGAGLSVTVGVGSNAAAVTVGPGFEGKLQAVASHKITAQASQVFWGTILWVTSSSF